MIVCSLFATGVSVLSRGSNSGVVVAPANEVNEPGTTHPVDATPFLPERKSLKTLREAAQHCRGCHLYEPAIQTVFGEGLKRARTVMVGEMPGDREDKAGRVFVGPAGRELDKALERIGLDRAEVYITNVVKHFKFEERGKRRIHQTPKKSEVDACFPWLREELAIIKPEALVILGATAGKALMGSTFRLTAVRGQPIDSDLAELVTATVHPSAILRAPDDAARMAERERFTSDLRTVVQFLAGSARGR
jgi:uracil-DNA glycosylase family protein